MNKMSQNAVHACIAYQSIKSSDEHKNLRSAKVIFLFLSYTEFPVQKLERLPKPKQFFFYMQKSKLRGGNEDFWEGES